MASTGDLVKHGSYQCRTCGEVIEIAEDSDYLPDCPNCEGTEWEPAGRGGRVGDGDPLLQDKPDAPLHEEEGE